MTLVVGHIAYANCAPFFHYLRAAGFSGEIIAGVPSQLNQMLAAGTIDVSPCSSFEYGRNWRDYLLLPGVSISTRGPVRSVLLFSPRPLDQLAGEQIALTGESASSVNLLKILLQEFIGLGDVTYTIPETSVEQRIAEGESALLIGDRALKMARSYPASGIYDLGELWYRFTGLPFVFALWILRRAAAAEKASQVSQLLAQLDDSRRRAFADLPVLAAAVPERIWMNEAALVDYWRTMSYGLDADQIRGLELFFRLSHRLGLLEGQPELHFFGGPVDRPEVEPSQSCVEAAR